MVPIVTLYGKQYLIKYTCILYMYVGTQNGVT